MKRNIEIDDTLGDCVQSAIDEVKEELLSYLTDNPDTEKTPCISNDLDYSGRIHEIIDGSVPIYTQEITDIFYLHGDDCEEAFDNAGIGDKVDGQGGFPMGWKAAAVYCYIEEKVHEWYRNEADQIFDDWKEARDEAAADKSA